MYFCVQNQIAMMTREEVAQVISYCEENKISYKQRLSELGIAPWRFYDAKRKYSLKHEDGSTGESLQLIPGGTCLSDPIKPTKAKSGKHRSEERGAVAVSIDLRTPSGTMMRISSELTGSELKDIIIASSAHV